MTLKGANRLRNGDEDWTDQNTALRIGGPATQAFLELLLRWRRDEDVTRLDVRAFDLLDTLHLNVQYHDTTLGTLFLNSLLACAVEVVSELGPEFKPSILATG